jgi:hypothetical protein
VRGDLGRGGNRRRRRAGDELRAARERCRAAVAGLPIGEPLDVGALCAVVRDRRGRPLHLLDIPHRGAGPSGLWIATAAADYVFYSDRAAPLHQAHIVLHELGHIVLDHRAAGVLDPEASRALLPGLDPDAVLRALSRTSYSDVEEREAEVFASLIMAPVHEVRDIRADPLVPPAVAETLRRLGAVLGLPAAAAG